MGWVKEMQALKSFSEDQKDFFRKHNSDMKNFLDKIENETSGERLCFYCQKSLKNRRPNVKFCSDSHRSSFYRTGSPKKHRKESDFGGLLNKKRASIANELKKDQETPEISDFVDQVLFNSMLVKDEIIKITGAATALELEAYLSGESLENSKKVIEEYGKKVVAVLESSPENVRSLSSAFSKISLKPGGLGFLSFLDKFYSVNHLVKKDLQEEKEDLKRIDMILRKEQKLQQSQSIIERTSPNIPIDPEIQRIRETLRKTIFSA